jgi:hypothetical protein
MGNCRLSGPRDGDGKLSCATAPVSVAIFEGAAPVNPRSGRQREFSPGPGFGLGPLPETTFTADSRFVVFRSLQRPKLRKQRKKKGDPRRCPRMRLALWTFVRVR